MKELLDNLNKLEDYLVNESDLSLQDTCNIVGYMSNIRKQAINYTHSSMELLYKGDDLLKAYQAGCIEGFDDCCDFGHDDLKELISDSIKWLKRYKDKAITWNVFVYGLIFNG